MTKKDLIIIAVLANMGILAVLFMLAIRMDEEPAQEQEEISYVIQEVKNEPEAPSSSLTLNESADEMDALLSKNSSTEDSNAFSVDEEFPLLDQDSSQAAASSSDDNKDEPSHDPSSFMEITVKRGDALEKIARSNGTTVEAIKTVNNLKSDRLKIGQVLQVPVGHIKENLQAVKKDASHSNTPGEQYYTVRNGDNPWKIAKQFNIKVYELLKLNDLDEDKARNLKVGDQIRVK
jgi:peptidoglycan endopeptidase LytF